MNGRLRKNLRVNVHLEDEHKNGHNTMMNFRQTRWKTAGASATTCPIETFDVSGAECSASATAVLVIRCKYFY
jgi:hypothetical protein